MMSLNGLPLRVILYTRDVDMRKSFNGLLAIVQSEFKMDVLKGDTFLFLSKRRDRVKAMWWDIDGLAIYMKKDKSEDTHFNSFTRVEMRRTFNGFVDKYCSTRIRETHSKRRNAMQAKPGRIAPPRA